MNSVVQFTVPGIPVAKGRPRFRQNGFAYTPQKTANFEALVKWEYHRQVGDVEPYAKGIPLEIEIEARFSPPASVSKKKYAAMINGDIFPTKIPDIDNVAKAVLDGLHGVCYQNDSSVVKLIATKRYASQPGTVVTVREVEGANSPK